MALSPWAEQLSEKYFGDDVHPYQIFENRVRELLMPDHVLLDAGCGYGAPVLQKFRGAARRLVGVDLVEFDHAPPDITLLNRDLVDTGLPDSSIDVVMSRSVMEHIVEPARTYAEMSRILRPGGHFTFLTGNLWDFAALIAMLVPNRLHPWIVARTQGRNERDTFPVAYRTNTRSTVARFAHDAGFDLVSFEYVGQYPAYFLFNGPLFLLATAYEKTIRRVPALHFLKGWILVVLRKRGS
jgi:SAM-dependent methyltransferase